MDNYILLNNWIYATIKDNPDIIENAKTPKDVYSELAAIFWVDQQKAFKQIAKEVLL